MGEPGGSPNSDRGAESAAPKRQGKGSGGTGRFPQLTPWCGPCATPAVVPPMLAHPKCPLCDSGLKLGKSGEVDAWSCPTGHALGIMISEAYGRVQDDEI